LIVLIIQCVHKVPSEFWKIVARKQIEVANAVAMKLLTTQCHLSSCYLLFLELEYSPQRSFCHIQYTCFPCLQGEPKLSCHRTKQHLQWKEKGKIFIWHYMEFFKIQWTIQQKSLKITTSVKFNRWANLLISKLLYMMQLQV
jgi:hypothetical protein